MSADLQLFERSFGVLGGSERRTFPLPKERRSVRPTQDGQRLKVQGYASVFGSPSVEMASQHGNFIEYINRDAFSNVLARKPDVLLTVDHDTRASLARTTSATSTLELTTDAHGLRFFAVCSRTSYAEDLRQLMEDDVINEASFLFRVAPGGEEWESRNGQTIRTVYEVGDLFDVCCCAAGAYPATASTLARSMFVNYAVQRRFLQAAPEVALAAAKARIRLRHVA